ncbi:MarR family winged helix-turn-helix transcriptional regulator [Aquabacterium sp.]|uniref:MarR family winged helix-turn-helix transcriptional regulator n=1 Tax=Aquabacterium sp. TaxID=1872578 RepID=UPI003782D7BD
MIEKVSDTPVDGGMTNSVYQVQVTNGATAIASASARIANAASGVTVVDGIARAGTLAAMQTLRPSDAITPRHGHMLSTELARRARMEPTRTSRTVTSLGSKALASRMPLPSDRRCLQIEPTVRARAILDSLYPVVTALDAHLTSAITESDRAHLDRIFAKLESAAEVMAAGPDLPHANRRRRRTTGA